jgi:hypothetical protein
MAEPVKSNKSKARQAQGQWRVSVEHLPSKRLVYAYLSRTPSPVATAGQDQLSEKSPLLKVTSMLIKACVCVLVRLSVQISVQNQTAISSTEVTHSTAFFFLKKERLVLTKRAESKRTFQSCTNQTDFFVIESFDRNEIRRQFAWKK